MGRRYTISFTGDIAAADGDVDLFEVTPADDKPVKLIALRGGQVSEVGDAQEEGIRLDVLRLPATFTSGSGGSAGTNNPIDSGDAAAGFASETKNTTVATTSGTIVTLEQIPWNVRNSPLDLYWPDEGGNSRYKVKQTEGLIIRWQTTVADTITVAFTLTVEEE